LAIDNFLDTTVENGVATNGRITFAEPRTFRVLLRYDR